MSTLIFPSAEQALAALSERFNHWRQTRASAHERIPEALWAEAVALSSQLTNSRVAKVLRLSPSDLKRRRLAEQGALVSSRAMTAPTFIEVTAVAAPQAPTPSPTLVEWERPDGARLRMHYREAAPVNELVRAFLEPDRC